MRVQKGRVLYSCGDRFRALYAIRIGTFKTLAVTRDGRERVTGYFLGGEIAGLDGIGERLHRCDAVAAEDSEVCVLPFEELDRLAQDMPRLRRNLYQTIANDRRRSQAMMNCAEERLTTFLLGLADRYQTRCYSSTEFVLRLKGYELASHLSLKAET